MDLIIVSDQMTFQNIHQLMVWYLDMLIYLYTVLDLLDV